MKKIFSKKIIIILGIAVLGVGLVSVPRSIKNKREQKLAEEKAAAETEVIDIDSTVSASGTVEAENIVILKFQASGKLAWIGVEKGDSVEQWQAIATLDKYELQRNLTDTLRDYSKERNDFEEEYRITYLEQTPQTALNDTAKRILEKNQWDLDKSVIDVEIAYEAVKLATLVTPIKGIVTDIEAPAAGMNITPLTAEFTVMDPSVMKFVANIDELDIARIEIGQRAEIILDAYLDDVFKGTVTKIGFASVTTSGGGTAFPVEISLGNNSDLHFRHGMNGDIEIFVDGEK